MSVNDMTTKEENLTFVIIFLAFALLCLFTAFKIKSDTPNNTEVCLSVYEYRSDDWYSCMEGPPGD